MLKVTHTSPTKLQADPMITVIKPHLVSTITYNDQKIAEVSSICYVYNGVSIDTYDETLIFHAEQDTEKFGDYDTHDEAVADILRRLTAAF